MAYKILVIEDDATLGGILKQCLERAGYETRWETDGQKGYNTLKEWKPDLVLLDIIVTTKNGYEILEEKYADESIKSIPVVIISNSGQPVEISRVLALGVQDYFIKAEFDPDEILAKILLLLTNSSVKKPQGQLSHISILYVEDDPFLSDLLLSKLKREGAEVFYAKDGEGALHIAETIVPSIIMLDLMLPGVNGIEVLKRLKEKPVLQNIPIIVFSNLGQDKDKQQTEDLGVVRHLIKAENNPDDIVKIILEVLHKY